MPFSGQTRHEFVFQLIAGVVGCECDSHGKLKVITCRPFPSSPIMWPMRHTAKFLAAGAFALLLATGASSHVVRAQAPPQQPPAQPSAGAAVVPQQQPTFRVSVDLVTTDAIPRDSRTQQFIADLEAGRVRNLRRRRQAEHRVDGTDPRWTRLQRAGAAAGARCRRESSCRAAGRPTMPPAASSSSSSTTCTWTSTRRRGCGRC